MDEEKFLQTVSILQDLDGVEMRKLLGICRRVKIPQGRTILKEGEPGNTMYIIEEGTVEVSKSLVMKLGRDDYQDREKVLTKFSAEDHVVFGEVSLFEQGNRTATIMALTDCVLLEISRPNFLTLAEENPRIGYKICRNIAQVLCSRLRKADEDTVKLTTALSIALSR